MIPLEASSSSSAFSLFVIGASRFHSPSSSCASSFFSVSCRIASLHLSFGLSGSNHFYIFLLLSLHISQVPNNPSLTSLLFSPVYVRHTCPCSYFFCPDLLNYLSSHHPSQHSQHISIKSWHSNVSLQWLAPSGLQHIFILVNNFVRFSNDACCVTGGSVFISRSLYLHCMSFHTGFYSCSRYNIVIYSDFVTKCVLCEKPWYNWHNFHDGL